MPLIQWIMQNLNTPAEVYGVVGGGSADVAQIFSYTSEGGVLVGGEVVDITIVHIYDDIAEGGAIVGGEVDDATIVHIYDDIAEGGVLVGGEALESIGSTNVVAEGGVVVGGTSPISVNHIYDESGNISGGVTVGGSATGFMDEVCNKYLLPNHPKPSTADYRPQNIAPLIEFFTPIVAGVLGQNVEACQIVFRYENNTPCNYEDDIFVQHPVCIGQAYNPTPKPTAKSPELLKYEEYAKRSQRLKEFMQKSPAKIEYFIDL